MHHNKYQQTNTVSTRKTFLSLIPSSYLSSVHKLNDVSHGIHLQFYSEVLQPQNDGGLHVLLAQLVLEEPAAGRHHHFVHIDVVILQQKMV